MSIVKKAKRGQLSFSYLVNSNNKIFFFKTFCDRNFQLKNPKRSICISNSLHEYVFQRREIDLGTKETTVEVFCLNFLVGVLVLYLSSRNTTNFQNI